MSGFASAMTSGDSWSVALEAIASIPFRFAYTPRESVVVASLSLAGDSLNLGPSSRSDLREHYEAKERGIPHPAATMLDRMATISGWGGLVVVWCEVDDRTEGRAVLDFLREIFGTGWPFKHHLGYYLVGNGGILGMSADGVLTGWRDELELGLTEIALSHEACEMPDHEEALRFDRLVAGADAPGVESARFAAAQRDWDPEFSRLLTSHVTWGLVDGEPLDARAQGELGFAFSRIEFRDAFLAWVVAGTPAVVDLLDVPCYEWLLTAEQHPPLPSVAAAQPFLARLVRSQPANAGAPILACAAYLAWFGGVGTLPRVLASQALQEDPEYPLAQLVTQVLESLAPPPWVGARGHAA